MLLSPVGLGHAKDPPDTQQQQDPDIFTLRYVSLGSAGHVIGPLVIPQCEVNKVVGYFARGYLIFDTSRTKDSGPEGLVGPYTALQGPG